jgi:hypothetical protein
MIAGFQWMASSIPRAADGVITSDLHLRPRETGVIARDEQAAQSSMASLSLSAPSRQPTRSSSIAEWCSNTMSSLAFAKNMRGTPFSQLLRRIRDNVNACE